MFAREVCTLPAATRPTAVNLFSGIERMRRDDWKTSILSDGYMIVRHPELQTTLHMAESVAQRLRIIAG